MSTYQKARVYLEGQGAQTRTRFLGWNGTAWRLLTTLPPLDVQVKFGDALEPKAKEFAQRFLGLPPAANDHEVDPAKQGRLLVEVEPDDTTSAKPAPTHYRCVVCGQVWPADQVVVASRTGGYHCADFFCGGTVVPVPNGPESE